MVIIENKTIITSAVGLQVSPQTDAAQESSSSPHENKITDPCPRAPDVKYCAEPVCTLTQTSYSLEERI